MVNDESALMTIPGTTPEDRESPARQKLLAGKAFQPADFSRHPSAAKYRPTPPIRRLHHG
jgi:hypothetical protein